MPTPIPSKSTWESNMLTYGQWLLEHFATIDDAGPGASDAQYNSVYYDGMRVWHQIYAYTADSYWLTALSYARKFYRDHYLAGPNSYAAAGYATFSRGLSYDYLRLGNTTSRDALISLSTAAAYAKPGLDPGSVTYLTAWQGARENAYALNCYMDLIYIGEAARTSEIDRNIENCLSHIEQWFGASPTAGWLQPFMGGLLCRTLIEYYEDYDADSRIPVAIKQAIDYLWTNCWIGDCFVGQQLAVFANQAVWNNSSAGSLLHTVPDGTVGIPSTVTSVNPGAGITGMVQVTSDSAGAFGGVSSGWFIPNQNAFALAQNYGSSAIGSRVPTDTGIAQDGWNKEPKPELNLLVAHAFAWYYRYSLDTTYRDRGDELFAGGAANGALDQNGGKNFDQNYLYSFDYVTWREEADALLDGSSSGALILSGSTSVLSSGIVTQTP